MHAFHLLHALWITLTIAAPIPTYQAFEGYIVADWVQDLIISPTNDLNRQSPKVTDVNNHAARSYSSTDLIVGFVMRKKPAALTKGRLINAPSTPVTPETL